MKRIFILFFTAFICIGLLACGLTESGLKKYFDFEISDYTVMEENDSHGGFHGDGSYYLILDCSQNAEKARNTVDGWEELPLSENLYIIMFGGEKDGINYGHHLAEEAHLPMIENGVYKFVDRHSESTDESDDSQLLDRSSYNFSLAVYDLDTDTLYYFEYDT